MTQTAKKSNDLLEELLHQTSKSSENAQETPIGINNNDSTEFLLAEFSEVANFWRHTDSRLESALGLYFTASGLISSGLALAYQQIANTRMILLITICVVMPLLIGGIILTMRIINTSIRKEHYSRALNLIRKYFADRDTSIRSYLYMPYNEVLPRKLWGPQRVLTYIVTAMSIWIGVLHGTVCSAIIWLAFPYLNLSKVLIFGSLVSIFAASIMFYLVFKRLSRKI